jgi:hypothetical protein
MALSEDLVVKLGPARVSELVQEGSAQPFEPMPGRAMKDWAQVPPPDGDPLSAWTAPAEEARAFLPATP